MNSKSEKAATSRQKLNSCDLFGRNIHFNLHGQEKIKTKFGSCMSILCFLAFVYFVAFKSITNSRLRYDKLIPITHNDFFLESDDDSTLNQT
jgi:hypothetical protein